MGALKNKLVTSVIWTMSGRFLSLFVQLIVTILISRLLTPYEYGIIGLLNVFIAIATIILESGFGIALIQKGNFSRLEASSVFYFNVIVAFVLYLLLYFLSPYIANFYGIPELTFYARIVFIIIPINSFAIIQNVLLQKEMNFKKIAMASCISAILSGIVGVYMAFAGFGIDALVWQLLTLNTFRSIFLILAKRWKPLFSMSIDCLKPLFAFGVNLMLSSLIIVVFNNIYTLIIGKVYTTNDVGKYNQAKRYEELSSNTITEVILNVSFPALVQFKDNIDMLKQGYRKIISMTVFIVAPAMLLLILLSDDLFILLLTDKWSGMIPYLKILCIYGMMFPLHQINNNILKVLKEGRAIFYLEIFRRVLMIVAIVCTIRISLEALLMGQIVSTLLIIIVNMFFTGRLIKYSLRTQILDIIPYYVAAILSGIITFILTTSISNVYVKLIAIIGIMVLCYLIICRILKLIALKEMFTIIKSKIK